MSRYRLEARWVQSLAEQCYKRGVASPSLLLV